MHQFFGSIVFRVQVLVKKDGELLKYVRKLHSCTLVWIDGVCRENPKASCRLSIAFDENAHSVRVPNDGRGVEFWRKSFLSRRCLEPSLKDRVAPAAADYIVNNVGILGKRRVYQFIRRTQGRKCSYAWFPQLEEAEADLALKLRCFRFSSLFPT